HGPLHALGFLVGSIQVGVTSVPRELANVTVLLTRPLQAAAAAAAGWGGCRLAGATLSPPRLAGGRTTEGKPLGFEAQHPGNPEGRRRAREDLIVIPELLKSCGGRAGWDGPGHPRPPAPTPAESEPKAKGVRRREEVAARLQARGGRRFVTSPVSQQARANRAPPTPGRPPRRPTPRWALRAFLRPRPGLPRRRGASRPAAACGPARARLPRPASRAAPRWAQRPPGGGAMLCFLRGMAFVPFLLVTWSSAAFIISYVVAVLSGHVNPFLPYISDTGTTPPESGIFGFMINFSAFLGAATMYTRYKIVEKQNQTSYFSTPVFNLVSLVLGLVGCIGMGIVANFQELAVPLVHDGGALLAFVCGVVYTLLQSVISYKSCPQWNSLSTCHVRMAISAVSCAAVVPISPSSPPTTPPLTLFLFPIFKSLFCFSSSPFLYYFCFPSLMFICFVS
uniref:DNA damage regulated autophagy modulator 1 n=1 Tax=Felis catus TaxID=9685 RepID=A0ABI7XR86_FELCA